MASEEQLAVIALEGRTTIDLARAEPDREVPQYPSWTLRGLAIHVAGVHGRTTAICRTLPPERIPTASLPADEDPFEWAEAKLVEMLQALADADSEAAVWTVTSDPRLAFWERRMIIETGVHRWDAQGAIGAPRPLSPVVATDGLDEFTTMYLPRLGDVPVIELVATDLDRSWRYGKGEPSAVVSGTASDLYLRLMSRLGVGLPPEWEQAVDGLGSPAD